MKRGGIIILAGALGLVALLLAGSAGAFPPERPSAQGGAPTLISYQGQLTDPSTGNPVADDDYPMTFKIYDAQVAGVEIWSETQIVAVSGGLFNVLLGSVNPLSASDFSDLNLWLEVEVSGEVLSPRQRLASVPYALNADTVDGQEASAFQGKYVRTVVVSPVPGDAVASGTALLMALGGIDDASATNPYLLKIEPGVYDLGTSALVMKEWVDIEGSGELVTTIKRSGSSSGATGTVVGASNAELRWLTVENTGGNTYAVAIYNSDVSPRLTHVTAIATASGGTYSYGVRNDSSSVTMTNVTASASGGGDNQGVLNWLSSATMTNVTVTGDYGIFNWADSGGPYTVRVDHSRIVGSITIFNESGFFTTFVGASQLAGGPVWGGGVTCAGVYDEDYTFYPSTCP
jgi:hypothetical protein